MLNNWYCSECLDNRVSWVDHPVFWYFLGMPFGAALLLVIKEIL